MRKETRKIRHEEKKRKRKKRKEKKKNKRRNVSLRIERGTTLLEEESPPSREKFVSPVTTSRSVLPKTTKDQKIARGKREETNRNRNKPQHRLRVRARLRRVFTAATEQRAPPFERQIWVCRAECAGQNLSIAHVAVGSRAWGGRQRGKKTTKRGLGRARTCLTSQFRWPSAKGAAGTVCRIQPKNRFL